MHRNGDESSQNGKDPVQGLEPFFELEVFIPKGMGKKVQANRCCTSFEKPVYHVISQLGLSRRGEKKRAESKDGKRCMYVYVNVIVLRSNGFFCNTTTALRDGMTDTRTFFRIKAKDQRA